MMKLLNKKKLALHAVSSNQQEGSVTKISKAGSKISAVLKDMISSVSCYT